MSDYLVYWRTFWTDVNDLAEVSYDWATNSRAFYERVKKGNKLWVVVSGGSASPTEWRLLHTIVVDRRSIKATKWGNYHMIGDQRFDTLYRLEAQPDLAAILRLLSFSGGRQIRVKGKEIGKALQTRGFRPLSEKDSDLLASYAATLLKVSPR